jgi:hypothetical protein
MPTHYHHVGSIAMNAINNFFLERYNARSASEAIRARHLYIFNWIFIIACVFLIPINIFTGDPITLAILPICIAATFGSQFLIARERVAIAAYVSLITCIAAIALDLFTSSEPPGNNIIYRGLLTCIVVNGDRRYHACGSSWIERTIRFSHFFHTV